MKHITRGKSRDGPNIDGRYHVHAMCVLTGVVGKKHGSVRKSFINHVTRGEAERRILTPTHHDVSRNSRVVRHEMAQNRA